MATMGIHRKTLVPIGNRWKLLVKHLTPSPVLSAARHPALYRGMRRAILNKKGREKKIKRSGGGRVYGEARGNEIF